MEISVQMPKKNEQQTKSEYMRTLHDTHSTHNTNTNETKTQSLQRLQNTSQNNQIHPENSYDKIPETSKQLNTKKNDKNNEDAHYNKIRKFNTCHKSVALILTKEISPPEQYKSVIII